MNRLFLKRNLFMMLGLLLICGGFRTVKAESASSFWDYATETDRDGDTVYTFSDFEMTIPKSWDGKYDLAVETDDIGTPLAVYHIETRKDFAEQNGDENRGVLFYIVCEDTYDSVNMRENDRMIGTSGNNIYCLQIPTDIQGVPEDASWNEYCELSQDIDWIMVHTKILQPGDGYADRQTVYTATASVNIRSIASTSGKILGVVPKGYDVTAKGAEINGWTPVTYGSTSGYIKSDYLKEKSIKTAGSNAAPTESEPAASQNPSSDSLSYEALRSQGGTISGNVTARAGDSITVQTDDGTVYRFLIGDYSNAVAGDPGDYIELSYIGTLNNQPQAVSAAPKASASSVSAGAKTITGTFVQEGQDIFTLRDSSGSEYTFYKSASYPAESFSVGASVTVTYYGDAGESAEIISIY